MHLQRGQAAFAACIAVLQLVTAGACGVDDEVRAHARAQQQLAFPGHGCGGGHAVARNQPGRQAFEAERKDARIGRVDQAQADALAALQGLHQAHLPVHRELLAQAAGVRHVVEVVEVLCNAAIGIEPPVIEQPDQVQVHRRRRVVLHDQRTGQAAVHLLGRAQVRVVPVGAGVGQREAVGKALTRRHRVLREAGYAVHGIGQADAVPVDGAGVGQLVVQRQVQHRTALETQLRAGHGSVIGPDRQCGLAGGGQGGGGGTQGAGRGGPGKKRCRQRGGTGQGLQQITAVHDGSLLSIRRSLPLCSSDEISGCLVLALDPQQPIEPAP